MSVGVSPLRIACYFNILEIQMSKYETIADLEGHRLARYQGQGWNGGLGIRAIGQSKYYIDESVKSLAIKLMNGTELVVTRSKFNGVDHDWGHAYDWAQLDFVCEYSNPITGAVDKFSLYKYLGGEYDNEDTGAKDNYTSNYVTVLKVNPEKACWKRWLNNLIG